LAVVVGMKKPNDYAKPTQVERLNKIKKSSLSSSSSAVFGFL